MVLYGRKIFNKYLLRKRISQLFFRLLRILFVSRQCLDNYCLGLPEFEILFGFYLKNFETMNYGMRSFHLKYILLLGHTKSILKY